MVCINGGSFPAFASTRNKRAQMSTLVAPFLTLIYFTVLIPFAGPPLMNGTHTWTSIAVPIISTTYSMGSWFNTQILFGFQLPRPIAPPPRF